MAKPGTPPAPPGAAPPGGHASSVRGSLERLSANPRARIGAAVAAAGVVVVLALHAKKKGATTTVTGTDASKTDNAAAGGVDPTIGEILDALDRQSSATATMVDAANRLADAAAANTPAAPVVAVPSAPAVATPVSTSEGGFRIAATPGPEITVLPGSGPRRS
jgi:hypothetical protein